MTPRCDTCRHWQRYCLGDHPMTSGDCCRFPPTIANPSGHNPIQMRPRMSAGDWCGEHADRERP